MTNEAKKSKSSKKMNKEDEEAIPPHIRNIMEGVEKKAKNRKKEHEAKQQSSKDSIALLRTMMSSVRTKYELSEAAEEERRDKEQDNNMINNARDIFKHLEHQEEAENAPRQEKVKRVEVKPDFLLSGQNKAEEMRKERLREMTAMKIARERQMEDDDFFQERDRGDKLRKERELEMDMMRFARQQAMEEEEEERRQEEMASRGMKAMSPGLAAARQGLKMEQREEEDRVDRQRLEREHELNALRHARAQNMEQDDQITTFRSEKSEATRELEAFRAASSQQGVRGRFQEQSGDQDFQQGQQGLTRAPRSKTKLADNWMRRNEEDKMEQIRRNRERELEMMLEARNQAFEEEEEERLAQEAMRREEAALKAREMAMLVAELQRMRNETQHEADQEEKMTRYQEEMMQRVMELHSIARGGLISE